MKKLAMLGLALIFSLYQMTAIAKTTWQGWLNELKQEATSEGIDPDLFEQLFADMSAPSQTVQHFNSNQPEHRITYPEYKNTRVDKYKIMIGRKMYKKHQLILQKVARAYNVN